MTNYARISGVPIETVLDTGSTRMLITEGTIAYLQRTLQSQGKKPAEIRKVKKYRVELADGSVVINDKRLVADVELCSAQGKTHIGEYLCTIIK